MSIFPYLESINCIRPERWLRFFEQNFCVVKWSSCRG
jgi:hypothetical protein